MHIEKVKGRKSQALKNMINEPVVDDCEEGVVDLYDCKRLNKRHDEWLNHGIMREHNGKKIEDSTPSFYVNAIKNIFVVASEYYDDPSIEDVLQFYIDPHHKPLLGIGCWDDQHAPDCDRQLHDALTTVYTIGECAEGSDKDAYRKFREAFIYVRRRLVMYGAKIP